MNYYTMMPNLAVDLHPPAKHKAAAARETGEPVRAVVRHSDGAAVTQTVYPRSYVGAATPLARAAPRSLRRCVNQFCQKLAASPPGQRSGADSASRPEGTLGGRGRRNSSERRLRAHVRLAAPPCRPPHSQIASRLRAYPAVLGIM